MIILIMGASHTGKTMLAQRLMEKHGYPYLSIDHLKMGLIRSGNTDLTPMDDDKLTDYLWPIIREIIATAIENEQNLIIEGCYIPYTWQNSFSDEYLQHIQHKCLIMSENYIRANFDTIIKFENVIEKRLSNDVDMESLIVDNINALKMCKAYGLNYKLIDTEYDV